MCKVFLFEERPASEPTYPSIQSLRSCHGGVFLRQSPSAIPQRLNVMQPYRHRQCHIAARPAYQQHNHTVLTTMAGHITGGDDLKKTPA